MYPDRNEADQVVDDATQGAAKGANLIGQAVENAVRAGKGRELLGGFALVYVCMGITLAVFEYLKYSEKKAVEERYSAQVEYAKTQATAKQAQAEQAKKLQAIAGGIPATQSSKASRALPGLRGTWTGVQSCGWWGANENTGIRLLLTANVAGHIDGVLAFHPRPNESSDVPYGSYRVSGDLKGTELSLQAGSWISQAAGYKAADLQLHLHKAPISSLRGNFSVKDYGYSIISVAAYVRSMLSSEKIEAACGPVLLYDNVESIDWGNVKAPATRKKTPAAGAASVVH